MIVHVASTPVSHRLVESRICENQFSPYSVKPMLNFCACFATSK